MARRWLSLLCATALAGSALTSVLIQATPAQAATSRASSTPAPVSALAPARTAAAAVVNGPAAVIQAPATTVSADALPTVQINGVVWTQAISGNTVFAGGKFGQARPAGAAPGTHQVRRNNLLSYNLTTGALLAGFAPVMNAQVLALAVTPDGTKLVVAGSFTSANGAVRRHLAAFSTVTGRLIGTFAPNFNGDVRALSVTNTTVYVGGSFSRVNGVARSNLAAVVLANGALTRWQPTTNSTVRALVLTPDHSMVIAGGSFTAANGRPAYGLVALRSSDGATRPWAAAAQVRDAGSNSAITSLTTDGRSVFGTGYVYASNAKGNLEGSFSANPDTGALNWVEDCHGDTYGAYSDRSTVYTVSHAHYCSPVGGFPQSPVESTNMRHALAFTAAAAGILGHDEYAGPKYKDWAGSRAPAIINWFPSFTPGSYTGVGQAAWSVTGNGRYVVIGGEFPSVNGVGQQGLVRFAVKGRNSRQGPTYAGADLAPRLMSVATGTVRVAFRADSDPDDTRLTYRVIRDGDTAHPISVQTVTSTFWNRPTITLTDTGLAPGSMHTYQVLAADPSGNVATGSVVAVQVAAFDPSSTYVSAVLRDGASNLWRLGSNRTKDYAGFSDLTVNGATVTSAAGPLAADSTAATTFDGRTSLATTRAQMSSPNTFSEEAWFSTTSPYGGKIIGFGDSLSGTSVRYDRQLFLNPDGVLSFGVAGTGRHYQINTGRAYNDGRWHQVVGTLSAAGMTLYVDGTWVGTIAGTVPVSPYSGFWQIGGDRSWTPSTHLQATIGDVAIYPTALTAAQVAAHFQAAAYVNQNPVSSFVTGVSDLGIAVDASGSVDPDGSIGLYSWTFGDGGSATGVRATYAYGAPGDYRVTLTVTDNQGARTMSSQVVTVSAPVVTPPPTTPPTTTADPAPTTTPDPTPTTTAPTTTLDPAMTTDAPTTVSDTTTSTPTTSTPTTSAPTPDTTTAPSTGTAPPAP